MNGFDDKTEIHSTELVDAQSKKPLVIFKAEVDRYGRDITAMSDFFDGYVRQMSLALIEQTSLEVLSELPVADLEIINDVFHQADVIMKGEITLLPDKE